MKLDDFDLSSVYKNLVFKPMTFNESLGFGGAPRGSLLATLNVEGSEIAILASDVLHVICTSEDSNWEATYDYNLDFIDLLWADGIETEISTMEVCAM